MAEGVSLRDFIDQGLSDLDRRIDDLLDASRRERDVSARSVEKLFDEAGRERDRIREAHGQFVTRTEFDLLNGRVGTLERSMARVYGALAVIVFLAGAVGVLVKYLAG